jgi:hypothetical protein
LKKCKVEQEEYAELVHQFDVNSAARDSTLKLKLQLYNYTRFSTRSGRTGDGSGRGMIRYNGQ